MKVVFDLALGRIAIEGDAPELLKVLDAARQVAPSITQIQIATAASKFATDATESSGPTTVQSTGSGGPPTTLRQFTRSLSLGNASERIAAVAYYMNIREGRPSWSPKEMDGWFTMCGFQKPSQIALAVFDAKRKYGFVDSVERGAWRISVQGQNLILRKLEEAGEQRAD